LQLKLLSIVGRKYFERHLEVGTNLLVAALIGLPKRVSIVADGLHNWLRIMNYEASGLLALFSSAQ
jgi:hypothetical protein